MDIDKIKQLIALLEESNLTEMEIQEGEDIIRLSRASPHDAHIAAATAVPPTAKPAPSSSSLPSTASESTEEMPGHRVTSPMVGTYYAAAGASEAPFVQIGSQVKPGDTLCIIEAMKIFNQIECDHAGTVKAIYKEPGDPVEYGELLFVIG